MSACSLFERVSMINNMDAMNLNEIPAPQQMSNPIMSGLNGPPGGPGPGNNGGINNSEDNSYSNGSSLERDYYGCYCLKFIVKNGTHISEEKVLSDFGQFGEVVDVRGPGLFSGLRGNHVYVRFIEKSDAEEAARNLSSKYHQLTPASISDVLPDNYGLYTISFYNKTGIPSSEVRKEFSKFGEVKNLTGSLDVKGGRVFVSYKDKFSAVQALQAFFFRKDRYPNMKFALPRCEKDYFGCYCLKFYNKSGDVTEEKVLTDFGQFGEVVDVRGPGLFDVTGDDVYVRYKEKSSAEQALIELVGKYDSLCLAPPSDIQADKFGYFTITFVNDKCLSKSDVWYIFSKFGTVACVNGTFDCKKGRVFVSYKEKQGALNALETMLITKEYHLQVSKNSTVRKNDYNVVGGNSSNKDNAEPTVAPLDSMDYPPPLTSNKSSNSLSEKASTTSNISNETKQQHGYQSSRTNNAQLNNDEMRQKRPRDVSHNREGTIPKSTSINLPPSVSTMSVTSNNSTSGENVNPNTMDLSSSTLGHNGGGKNGVVKFNRNVEKDIFGFFCLSFLNEDGDISEKKVRHDFGKFGEVVSVRGALGKQKGHVFVRFRRKEAAENCLNCLNSFPLSEMSELFGKYLFLSPATPRDIDCDMYGLYSISFLNLNMISFNDIRAEFSKFGEVIRLTTGGSGNTDELISISYADKPAAIKALQTHFSNKEFPYLDIAKGSSLLLVNSSDSSDNEENESDYIHRYQKEIKEQIHQQQEYQKENRSSSDPFHDPNPIGRGFGGQDIVDELLKPFQSYFNIYRTGQYQGLLGESSRTGGSFSQTPLTLSTQGTAPPTNMIHPNSTNSLINGLPASPSSKGVTDNKKYRIKSVKSGANNNPKTPFNVPVSVPAVQNSLSGHPMPSHPISSTTIIPSDNVSESTAAANLSFQRGPAPSNILGGFPIHKTTAPISNDKPNHITKPNSSTQSSPERDVYRNTSPARFMNKNKKNDNKSVHLAKKVQDAPQPTTIDKEEEKPKPIVSTEVKQDLWGGYSLSFSNKIRDLNERRLKQDFGQDVIHVRGLSGLKKNEIGNGEIITVCFSSSDQASKVLEDSDLYSKYHDICCSSNLIFKADKSGVYNVDFINSGMNMREITCEFSRHGEVAKVKTAADVRVTVSFFEKNSAIEAVIAFKKSKDFISVDFSRECLAFKDLDNNQQQ